MKIIFCVVVSLFPILLSAQELSKSELEKNSLKSFDQKKYELAQPGFEELVSIYPKEPSYNYYLGCCYLNLNIKQEEAVKYLRFAASKNFKPNAHYYLALAYFRNYQFDEAEISTVNFINLAKNKDLLSLKPENLLMSINRSREETYISPKLKVFSKEELNNEQIESVYALHIKGKFIPKDHAFMQRSDVDKNYQGIMYVTEYSENGNKLYFSSIGKSGRTGKDIFSVKQLTAMDYSLPEDIKEVNSKYDEEYPYFDAATQTLYFSSTKPGGMGGYDIYKCIYSKETNKFSEPKSLDFPINTPYDDFLYVPDSIGKSAIFLSNRSNSGKNLTAYKVEIDYSPVYVFPKTLQDIKELATLNISIKKEATPIVVENLSPARKPVVISEYDLLLQDALTKQLNCDSLQGVILSKKNKLRVEQNLDARRILVSSISIDEENLKSNQNQANELFARAEKLHNTNNDIQIAKAENSTVQPEESMSAENNSNDNGRIYLQSESILNNTKFDILNSSPYSEKTPIPETQELTDGLVYRIQLGAFNQNLPNNAFGGLTPLTAEKLNDRNVTKYYVGYFASSKEARKALDKVKNYGYNDAFLVPFYNKSKITVQAAREIEFKNLKQAN
jgi:hypothetical protein